MIYWQYTAALHYSRVKHNILGITLHAVQFGKTYEKFLLITEPLKFPPYLFPHLIFVGDIGTMTIFLAVLFAFSFAGNALGIGL